MSCDSRSVAARRSQILICESAQTRMRCAWRVGKHLSGLQHRTGCRIWAFVTAWMKSGMDHARRSAIYTEAFVEATPVRGVDPESKCASTGNRIFAATALWKKGALHSRRDSFSVLQPVVFYN